MKTKFENKVLLTLRVSNGTQSRPAVKAISDKMTVVRTYLNTGKGKDGNYNPALNFEVQIFTEASKSPTENLLKSDLKDGDYITVEGSLSSRQNHVGDTVYTDQIIKATRIMAAEVIEETEHENAADSFRAPSAWEL